MAFRTMSLQIYMQAQLEDLGIRKNIESLWISLRYQELNYLKHQSNTPNSHLTDKDLIRFADELAKKSYLNQYVQK